MSKSENKQFEFYPELEDQEIPSNSIPKTDFVTQQIHLSATDGATKTDDYIDLANTQSATGWLVFNLNSIPDFNRNMKIEWILYRTDGGADWVTIKQYVGRVISTGTSSITALTNWNDSAGSIMATVGNRFVYETWTIDKGDFDQAGAFKIRLTINEAGKTFRVYGCSASYYSKRDLSLSI